MSATEGLGRRRAMTESRLGFVLGKLGLLYGKERFWLTDPFKVLIATILSQRTRDENTEKASRALFREYSTARKLARAPLKSIEKLVKPSGFYRVKAKRVREVARMLVENYGGKVPADITELLSLPGVGRKTANCVLVYGFGKKAIPVDTHVHRISNRLGLVETRTPGETEKALEELVPRRHWMNINHFFVRFGQNICRPIKPRCIECSIDSVCLSRRID